MKTIETELRLGLTSEFHANRIMQFKGLSYDKKTSMIQEKIASLIQSRSKDFGRSIFTQMQQFLVNCSDEFKTQRDYHHISRIISVLYLMRKVLNQKNQSFADKRHIIIKFLKTKLYAKDSARDVLGIIVGLNFLKEHEIFEKKHLIKAIQKFIPGIIDIENSYFIEKNSGDSIQTLYLEVEKSSKKSFAIEEIDKLKASLPMEISSNIERLMHRVFMPRNEEEIVRNILILTRQLRFINDIPQVIINFDEQTSNDLSFNVILLRIIKSSISSIDDLFKLQKNQGPFLLIRADGYSNHISKSNIFLGLSFFRMRTSGIFGVYV